LKNTLFLEKGQHQVHPLAHAAMATPGWVAPNRFMGLIHALTVHIQEQFKLQFRYSINCEKAN